MEGRVAALILVVGGLAVGSAAGQPAPPPDIRPDPAGFLLPPVASAEGSSRRSEESSPPTEDLPPRARAAAPDRPPPAARLAAPRDITPVSAKSVEAVRGSERPPEKPLKGDELFSYLSDGPRRPAEKPARESEFGGRWRDKIQDALDPEARRGWIRSDHAFDCVVSPITNPFFFEDPRALTEVRPIFIYQKVPTPQPNFAGGDIYFFGGQARIAFAERFSLVVHKVGGMRVNTNSPALGDDTGLAEVWLGPKVTLIRDAEFGTLLAAGAQFQLPIGSPDVYQDTGSLSIVPYLSFGQRFLQTRIGSFNALASAGYSFSTDKQRSDFLYLSGHLAFDVGNAHRFYPIAELNWFHYTTNGTARMIKGEGRDLINFGSLGKGSNLLTGAVGARVKLTRNTELGGAFEYPLVGNKDFFDYRFTVDFIWRY